MMNRRQAVMGALASVAASTFPGVPSRAVGASRPDALSVSGTQALARAESTLGHKTMYAMGLEIDPAKQWRNANDCSGLVLWAFGFTRQDFAGDRNVGSTDAIYANILSLERHFVRTPEPRIGGIVIYPSFQMPGASERDFGHVGIIKSVQQRESCTGDALATSDASGGIEERYPLQIYDCSATSWWTYGDAVRVSDYLKFLLHDEMMVAAARAGAPPANVRRPIYAALRGEQIEPAAPAVKLGHCPAR